MAKEILFVLSEWGYWGEELIGPLECCDAAGYEITFLTPTGKKPIPLTVSVQPGFSDPALGRSVTSEEMAEKTRKVDESERLNSPKSLEDWFPLRPYISSSTYLQDLEAYYREIDQVVAEELASYSALIVIGGSGAMVDLANNNRLHELILGFYRLNKTIVAECYGVACLAFARDLRRKNSLIWSKRVTGHPIDYDYLDNTSFEGFHAVDGSNRGFGDGYINFGPPFYPLEFILRDAVGPNGAYISGVGHETSVIVDYPFITSRSTASSVDCGRKLVEVLEQGLTRYGW